MGDSIIFNDTMNCSELTTRMFVVNTGADLTYVGLRSIELINSVNSIVKFVNPSKLIDIPGSIEATIKVTPIDATKDASGTLLIKDRSGKVWNCLLYTSDAADERSSVDLGGRRIIKKK